MSSTSANTSNDSNMLTSAYRVNYSEYVADITGSPKTARKVTPTATMHNNNPLVKPHPNRSNQPTHQTGAMPQYGGGADKCARCLKTVYLAEKKIGAGRSFHISCFNCRTCRRKLDTATLSEHKGEIYCKSCYTKQFGPHGLAAGVSMSTETALIREGRVRRSSYGDDLDPINVIHSQTRPRAISTENLLHETHGTKRTDDFSSKYPRNYDGSPERNSPSNRINSGVTAIVDTKRERSRSPSISDKFNEPKTHPDSHRSNYVGEDDRSKYIHQGEQFSYSGGSSAFVNVPVVINPKPRDSTIRQVDIPIEPYKDNNRSRSRSPSTVSNDPYRRQSSRERQTDISDDYSRLNMNTDNNNQLRRQQSQERITNSITSGSPNTSGSYYQSASSHESRYTSSASTTTVNDRRSPSPRNDSHRPGSSALADFVSKTNVMSKSPSTEKKFSAVDSLVSNIPRPTNRNRYDDFDD